MKKLYDTELIKVIDQSLNKKKNFLGICLGMQLLFKESSEFKKTKGIGFFDGEVKNFESYHIFYILLE